MNISITKTVVVALMLTSMSHLASAAPVTGHGFHKEIARGCNSDKHWVPGRFCQSYTYSQEEKAQRLKEFLEGQEQAALDAKTAQEAEAARDPVAVLEDIALGLGVEAMVGVGDIPQQNETEPLQNEKRHIPVWSIDPTLTNIEDIPNTSIEERASYQRFPPPIGDITGHCGEAYVVASHDYLNKMAKQGATLASMAADNNIKRFFPVVKGQEENLPFCAGGGIDNTPEIDIARYTVPNKTIYELMKVDSWQSVEEAMDSIRRFSPDADVYFPTTSYIWSKPKDS